MRSRWREEVISALTLSSSSLFRAIGQRAPRESHMPRWEILPDCNIQPRLCARPEAGCTTSPRCRRLLRMRQMRITKRGLTIRERKCPARVRQQYGRCPIIVFPAVQLRPIPITIRQTRSSMFMIRPEQDPSSLLECPHRRVQQAVPPRIQEYSSDPSLRFVSG